MKINCPSCMQPIEQNSVPIRGPAGDGSEAWLCIKCPATVCIACYVQHTAKEHPEMGTKVTAAPKKNRKHKK